MEKKGKVGEKNKTKKEEVAKKVIKEDSGNRVVFTKSIKRYTKIITLVMAFFGAAASIFMFVFGIIVSLNALNLSKLDFINDNFSMTFLSNLHGLSIGDVQTLFDEYGSGVLFVILKIALPVLAFVLVMILIILLAKNVLYFVEGITTEKELYTKNNVKELETIGCYLLTIVTVTVLVFDTPSVIVYALICLLMFVAYGLFKKIVNSKK